MTNQSGGGGTSLPGVTPDGLTPAGITVAGRLLSTSLLAMGEVNLGGFIEPEPNPMVRTSGRVEHRETPSSSAASLNIVDIIQDEAITSTSGASNALWVAREGDISASDYTQPLAIIADYTASGQDTLLVSKAAGIGNAINVNGPAVFSGVLGEHGKAPATTPATITGNVTTGTLANLQAVVGQLLTALDAKGSIIKSTT